MHLIVNLLVQILLGIPLEMVHKWWRVLIVYFAGVLAGSLGTSIVDPAVKLAGASGGVYSLLAAHVATIIMVSPPSNTPRNYPLKTLVLTELEGDVVPPRPTCGLPHCGGDGRRDGDLQSLRFGSGHEHRLRLPHCRSGCPHKPIYQLLTVETLQGLLPVFWWAFTCWGISTCTGTSKLSATCRWWCTPCWWAPA